MVQDAGIRAELKELNRLFNNFPSNTNTLFFSKLAIIELCGWTEICMDEIVLTCARQHLKPDIYPRFENDIVKRTYGFNYEDDFRRMLIHLIGLVKMEQIESNLDQQSFQRFKSELGSLKQIRDKEVAHTYIAAGVTLNIDAPSKTIKRFEILREGLQEIESNIKKIRF